MKFHELIKRDCYKASFIQNTELETLPRHVNSIALTFTIKLIK